MIVRAVSDSESDDDNDRGTSSSVFGVTDVPSLQPPLPMHVAKRVWIGATLALVVLVLVDLAALTSAFAPSSATGIAPPRDPFALVPLLLDAYFASSSALAAVVTSATALNNIVGLIGVTAWIISREAAGRRRYNSSSSSGVVSRTLRSPYTLVAGVLCFGHVVSCLYVLLALVESHGDRKRFFLGASSSSAQRRTSPYV